MELNASKTKQEIADFHLKCRGNIAKKLKNVGKYILNMYLCIWQYAIMYICFS